MVNSVLKKHDVGAVMDLGCGEGSLLGFLSGDPAMNLLIGVDLLPQRLAMAADMLRPTKNDVDFLRDAPLTVRLYRGAHNSTVI